MKLISQTINGIVMVNKCRIIELVLNPENAYKPPIVISKLTPEIKPRGTNGQPCKLVERKRKYPPRNIDNMERVSINIIETPKVKYLIAKRCRLVHP